MKILNLILVLTLALIVVGCQEVVIEDGDEDLNPDSSMEEEEESETEPSESQENEDESLGCEGNSDCTGNEVCIDNECGTVAQLYKTEGCQETCNFNNVNITTSDDQSFTLSRGKGSYTAAGALEWKIVTGPDYCSGEDIIVPLRIIKKNFGEVLSEEYVTVGIDELSKEITHSAFEDFKFTFTVKDVEETCE